MSNGMSPRIRHVVAGLAAFATTALLMSTLVGSFDLQLIQSDNEASAPISAVTADVRRNALIRLV